MIQYTIIRIYLAVSHQAFPTENGHDDRHTYQVNRWVYTYWSQVIEWMRNGHSQFPTEFDCSSLRKLSRLKGWSQSCANRNISSFLYRSHLNYIMTETLVCCIHFFIFWLSFFPLSEFMHGDKQLNNSVFFVSFVTSLIKLVMSSLKSLL